MRAAEGPEAVLFGGLPRGPQPSREGSVGVGGKDVPASGKAAAPTSRTLTADDSNWRARRCQLGASLRGRLLGPLGAGKLWLSLRVALS